MNDDSTIVARVFTAQEVARRQHVSLDTVKRALKAGLLRGHRIGTRGDWRVTAADEADWVARGAPTSVKKTKEQHE